SVTQKPSPPQTGSSVHLDASKEELKPAAVRVLATLWRYQTQLFGSDPSKRWTFAINPVAKEFSEYLEGLSEVVKRGWVAVSTENNQCMLTNEGLAFLGDHPEIQNSTNYYQF